VFVYIQHCFTGAILSGDTRGEMKELASLQAYFTSGTRAGEEQTGRKKVIVLWESRSPTLANVKALRD
jgi:hypothetical protein